MGKELARNDELNKIIHQAFDRKTVDTLYWMANTGVIETLDYCISTGKEGNVFRATTKKGDHVAIKVYRILNSDFKNMQKYIAGDHRFFQVKHDKRSLVYTWCKKEYANLERAYKNKIRVPKPIKHRKNCLVMEYIQDEGKPAPALKDAPPKKPAEVFEKLMKYHRDMYQKAGLVHGDLSEYNVLMQKQKPVIIDMGQAVLAYHPLAKQFYARDVENLCKYFSKLGVETKKQKTKTLKLTQE